MSRCKACDAELIGASRSYKRTVVLEDGSKIQVDEDLCLACRAVIFRWSDPEDFDLIDALGVEAEDGV